MEPAGTMGDSRKDAVVHGRFPQFLEHQVFRFLLEMPAGGQQFLTHRFFQISIMGQIQKILGNPITDAISHHFFLFCPSWEKPDGFVIGESMEFQLGRPPSVKRTLVTEHLPLHETHG